MDREWMLTIAYHRESLDKYTNNELIRKIASANKGVDYIVAPIADNRMFEIINCFEKIPGINLSKIDKVY